MAKMGRPKAEINLETAEKLGQIQCTYKECAAFFNVSVDTLNRRPDFIQAFKKGLEVGKMSLRRTQFRLAEKSAGMAIWLGKQYLDQKDNMVVGNEELINSQLEFKIPSNGKGLHRFEQYIHR